MAGEGAGWNLVRDEGGVFSFFFFLGVLKVGMDGNGYGWECEDPRGLDLGTWTWNGLGMDVYAVCVVCVCVVCVWSACSILRDV